MALIILRNYTVDPGRPIIYSGQFEIVMCHPVDFDSIKRGYDLQQQAFEEFRRILLDRGIQPRWLDADD